MKLSTAYVPGCHATLVMSGQPYFSCLLHMIREATHFIHLHTYSWQADDTGEEVLQALLQAAARNVQVFVVTDSYGTRLPSAYIRRMHQGGIHFRVFSPFRGIRVGRRLHEKVLVTGNGEALIGGINLSDKYHGSEHVASWLDFAVRIRGPIVQDVVHMCEKYWRRRKKKRHVLPPVAETAGNMQLMLARNNWYKGRREISRSYLSALASAQSEVLFVAAYFLPGYRIRRAIADACARGVKVRILLSGISDVPFVKPAITFLYDWMLRCGIGIYEWEESVLHGKVMVADGCWSTIGSYNVNSLSDYGSVELNVNIYDKHFAAALQQTIEACISKGSRQISPERYRKSRSIFTQPGHWFSYYLLRFSARFFLWLSDDTRPGKKRHR